MSMSSAAPELASIPLPPELPAEHVEGYVAHVREHVIAAGKDPVEFARQWSKEVQSMLASGIDPFDPRGDEIAFSGTAEECIRHLEPEDADDIIRELRAEGLLCDTSP